MSAPPPAGLFGEDFDPPGGRRATAVYVELLEELTEQNGRKRYTSPAEYIPARMVDLARAQACLMTAPSADIRRRLHRVFAKNAGFIATRLYDIADGGDTFEWFGIARRAARLAEDTTVQAWLAGRAANACACYHQFKSGLTAAHAAQAVGARNANPAAVMGYLAEASLQARMGRRRETLDAVRDADRMFTELPDGDVVADGFIVSEYVLRWHQADALALVGEHAQAAPVLARAVELPPAAQDEVGRALLSVDLALAHIDGGELERGCHTISTTWQGLPAEFHVGLVPDRILRVLDTLSGGRAADRHVGEVRQLLESSTGRGLSMRSA